MAMLLSCLYSRTSAFYLGLSRISMFGAEVVLTNAVFLVYKSTTKLISKFTLAPSRETCQ